MGLFSTKKKVTVEDMSMDMMHAAHATIGKIKGFNDVDDMRTMAVSVGYFFGFLRLHLSSITSLATTNTIINKSMTNFEQALKKKTQFANFAPIMRMAEKNASDNMKYAMKELRNNPFMGMAVFYLKDLYNSSSLDISKVEIAENTMRFLYGQTSNLTKNIKIVK